MWEPSERYPDPAVRVLDPAFNQYRLMLASVERLYTGCRWSEGPVWFGGSSGRATPSGLKTCTPSRRAPRST